MAEDFTIRKADGGFPQKELTNESAKASEDGPNDAPATGPIIWSVMMIGAGIETTKRTMRKKIIVFPMTISQNIDYGRKLARA